MPGKHAVGLHYPMQTCTSNVGCWFAMMYLRERLHVFLRCLYSVSNFPVCTVDGKGPNTLHLFV